MKRPSRLPTTLLVLTLVVLFNCGGTVGCSGVLDEFRAASSTDLEAGVKRILDGVVTGVFAVFTPDESGSSSGTGSSGSSGSSSSGSSGGSSSGSTNSSP